MERKNSQLLLACTGNLHHNRQPGRLGSILPSSNAIKFKILLLTFKCLYGQAPNYLIDFITIKKQSRYSLRSNESIFLELPGIKTHPTLSDRAFQSAAPYLWNALPSAIPSMKTLDTFKTAVKTHFFNLAFK